MKTPESVIGKFLSGLESWSDTEIRRLADLLDDAASTRRLRRILLETSELRNAERNLSTHTSQLIDSHQGLESSADEREFVTRVLSDRRELPSTRDVVRRVNSALRMKLRYEDFRREGRDKVISWVWRELADAPADERAKAIERLVLASTRPSDAYLELFRKLVHK